MSLFVPTTQKEAQQLSRHLDYRSNCQLINETEQSPAFQAEIAKLRKFHAHLFANLANGYTNIHTGESGLRPTVEQRKSGCVWQWSGLTDECNRVAEQYQVPHYDVVGLANSAGTGGKRLLRTGTKD
jgi:hypothetical protein